MSTPDPLWQALVAGDERCPDGAQLARLGVLARQAATPPRPVDLQARVCDACAALPADAAIDDPAADPYEAAVDAIYGDAPANGSDPLQAEIASIGALAREAATPDEAIDLLPRLEGQLEHIASRRLRRQPPRLRWRVISAVVLGHVAALVVLTVLHGRISDWLDGDGGEGLGGTYLHPLPAHLTSELPRSPARSWHAPDIGLDDVLAWRRSAERRDQASIDYGLAAGRLSVRMGLTWLVDRLGPDGHFADQSVTPDIRRDALALLALYGEGLAAEENPRRQAQRALLDRLVADHREPDSAPPSASAGLLLWALTDAVLVDGDQDRRQAFTEALPQLRASTTADDPLVALSAELARLGQLPWPEQQPADTDEQPATAVVDEADDPWLGFRCFVTQVREGAHASQVVDDVVALARHSPQLRQRRLGHTPLAWLGTGMAVRAIGGTAWREWAEALQEALVPPFTSVDSERAYLPATQLIADEKNHGLDDVGATALAIAQLQLAYRYQALEH